MGDYEQMTLWTMQPVQIWNMIQETGVYRCNPAKSSIIISVGLFGHSGDVEVWAEGTKEMLDDMHLRKIDLADEIFVINVGGYIGSSTKTEIEYAEKTGKPVRYLEERM